jgi:hypothetical protein
MPPPYTEILGKKKKGRGFYRTWRSILFSNGWILVIFATYRIRNKAKLKPIDLADPRNTDLRDVLRKAETELTMLSSSDVVLEDDDTAPGGPGSESD